MTRKYETMFIIKPTLTKEEIEQRVEFIKETLTKQGAEIKAVHDMGMKNLAYKIEKHERGYYTIIYFIAGSTANKELERIYGITEDIIRFNVIGYDKKIEIAAWENMAKKALGEPIVEKKLSFAPPRDRKPRFDRNEKRPPYNKDNKRPEYKKPEAPKTKAPKGE